MAENNDARLEIEVVGVGNEQSGEQSVKDIQKGITAMIKKGNKPRTVKSYVDYIKILFNYAISKDMLIKNPTKGVIIPKNRKERRKKRNKHA